MSSDAPPLTAHVVPVDAIDDERQASMYRLFSRYYAGVTPAGFDRDLRDKSYAIILEAGSALAGFSTARLFDFAWRGETIGVLFSGDTIVDRAFWGEQVLARAALGEIGRIARRIGGRRLVWFLIVKGHRTFRYLPVFGFNYVPALGGGGPAELVALRDAIADAVFGPAFDPARGVIRFDQPRDRLRREWAEPTTRERRLPEVAHFLTANPGYATGDELACLCELSRANMRPRAQRWFDAGFNAA